MWVTHTSMFDTTNCFVIVSYGIVYPSHVSLPLPNGLTPEQVQACNLPLFWRIARKPELGHVYLLEKWQVLFRTFPVIRGSLSVQMHSLGGRDMRDLPELFSDGVLRIRCDTVSSCGARTMLRTTSHLHTVHDSPCLLVYFKCTLLQLFHYLSF